MASGRIRIWVDLIRDCLPRTRQRATPHSLQASSPTYNDQLPTGVISTQAAPIQPIPLVPVAASVPQRETSSQGPAVGVLKTVLGGLQASLSEIPLLQSAVSELLECIVHVQVEGQNRQAYEELASDLTNLANLLQKHDVRSKLRDRPYSIDTIARAIGEQTTYIKEQQARSRIGRLTTANDGEGAVLKCYQRILVLFQNLQTDITLNTYDLSLNTQNISEQQQADTRLERLAPVHDARYNAALSVTVTKRVACTENTRVELLDSAQKWSRGGDVAKIYWLNGMAGTGKTTIAYTLCEMLHKGNRLGASFFCSRNSPDCRDVNRIVPTIAYQLGRYSETYQQALCNVLGKEPDIAKQDIRTQFEQLVSKPLEEMGNTTADVVVVVIDALDECSDVNGTRQILDLLFSYVVNLPIRFFVTSRPEPAIFQRMTIQQDSSRSIVHLHDIEQSLVQADIQTYLEEALFPLQLPPEQIELLTRRAGRLFIFAATVVRYIAPEDESADHNERVSAMLEPGPKIGNQVEGYEELDELYSIILSKALGTGRRNEQETRRSVLKTVVCAYETMNMNTLAQALGVENERKIELAIRPLRSVLNVSEVGVVSTLHASFPDFLLNEHRSGEFYCNRTEHDTYLVTRCFNTMRQSLCFNICRLESSYQRDEDVPALQSRIDTAISPALFYMCRYWGDHLSTTTPSSDLMVFLEDFLTHRLLFWMEVLSLKRCVDRGEDILGQVLTWLPAGATDLSGFAYDARNFVTSFAGNPTSHSTPHIYISTLPFTSKQSLVWKTYWPRTQGLVRVEGAAMGARGQSALATWVVGGEVYSIGQSSDGKRIVAGSGQKEVSIWDASRGTRVLGPLEGHDNMVWSVAFSPDNTRIASGSWDHTIRVWDAQNGNLTAGPLRGHTAGVNSVTFSPDGTRLASGSDDHTIRMWDAHTGAAIGNACEGHQGGVWAVAFSPVGEYLSSGSEDYTIRVWNWRTRVAVREPMKGHTELVLTIAYSSDGGRLASGSYDRTVRVWDMSSGTLLVGPLEGHTMTVWSVAFSSNNTRIVSGSEDNTIRVWDAANGNLLAGPFEGHGSRISSVLFTTDSTRILSGSTDGTIRVWDVRHRATGATESTRHTRGIHTIAISPCGTRVASGSSDKTICVWDTRNGALVAGPFTGHTDPVNAVAFSPDGARIVSASHDYTLRTWDAPTATSLVGPFEGHTDSVLSVAFSPDGSQIASGSGDRTIRLWDSYTGASVGEPFEGHTERVTSIAFSPNGARIVSGSWDKMVRMWDASDGTVLWTSDAHTRDVNCVAFSPDGTRVVSGSDDWTILVLDAGGGAVLRGPFRGHTDRVWSVTFSPDGTRIVSGSRDETVRVWDAESGTMVASPLQGHRGWVTSVAFSHDGARIISGSADASIRFWDAGASTRSDAISFHRLAIRDDHGWLTNSDLQLLLWVPSDLRRDFLLPIPSNPIVISGTCSASVHNSMLLLGNQWHKCFQTK